MWFRKQRDALQYESEHPGFVIAEDISSHGHKRYGVIARSDIDTFTGPYNELIRVLSMCRLYFDLDGPGDTPVAVIDEVIEAVNVRLFATYGIQAVNVQILCSSTSEVFEAPHFPKRIPKQLAPYAQFCGNSEPRVNRPFRIQPKPLLQRRSVISMVNRRASSSQAPHPARLYKLTI